MEEGGDMMNARRTEEDDDGEDRTPWTRRIVSWGHLVAAVIPLVVGLFVDRLAFEKRFTILEERQAYMARSLGQMETTSVQMQNVYNSKINGLQSDVNRKLDTISQQLNQLVIEVTKQQAGFWRHEQDETNRPGIKIPKTYPGGG
jgi:uncharacterized protein YoxC